MKYSLWYLGHIQYRFSILSFDKGQVEPLHSPPCRACQAGGNPAIVCPARLWGFLQSST